MRIGGYLKIFDNKYLVRIGGYLKTFDIKYLVRIGGYLKIFEESWRTVPWFCFLPGRVPAQWVHQQTTSLWACGGTSGIWQTMIIVIYWFGHHDNDCEDGDDEWWCWQLSSRRSKRNCLRPRSRSGSKTDELRTMMIMINCSCLRPK